MAMPPVTRPQEAREYLDALRERKRQAEIAGRINNANLRAGSPMYYYCDLCGLLADKLPETHVAIPKQYCAACQEMLDRGYSPSLGKFPGVDASAIDTHGETVGHRRLGR